MGAGTGVGADAVFAALLAGRAQVRTVYQPIVDLTSAHPIGYEALARGPAGSALESADALLGHARGEGRLAELDWLCQDAALRNGVRDLPAGAHLFVNAEPSALHRRAPARIEAAWAAAQRRLSPIVEFSERSVLDYPAELLQAVARARGAGIGIALDDVGSDPASLALMPFVNPDVIKLDMRLVHDHPDKQLSLILRATHAQVERTGATILAEGIETLEHLHRARELGATLGQGWLFGHPAAEPLHGGPHPMLADGLQRVDAIESAPTPFSVVLRRGVPRHVARRGLLELFARDLEDLAPMLPTAPVVLACWSERTTPSADALARYDVLAQRCCFVATTMRCGARGIGPVETAPAPGTVGSIEGEWAVIVLSGHFAGALIARELADDTAPGDDRFEYALVHDRETVVAAAFSLLGAIAAAGPLTRAVPSEAC